MKPLLFVLLLLVGSPVAADQDERSVEVLRFDCRTDTTRHEITLFGNGTIRVRDGLIDREWMGLAELGSDERQGFVNRLAGEDLSESASPEKGVEGAWVEPATCASSSRAKPVQAYRFGALRPALAQPLPGGAHR